jgi:peroxiredoxin
MTSPEPAAQIKDSVLSALASGAPLNECLAAIASRARTLYPDFAVAINKLIARLRNAGAGTAAPKPGEPMPPFILPDETGRLVSLAELLQQGPLAVCFHRGHWCPYCRLNMIALAKAQGEIEGIKGHIVAITPERWHFATMLKHRAGATFPALTDLDNGYALAINIAIWLGPEMEGFIAERGHDLPAYQGNKSWIVPIPATFVVGTDGLIAARYIDPDYRQRMSIEDLVAALKQAH